MLKKIVLVVCMLAFITGCNNKLQNPDNNGDKDKEKPIEEKLKIIDLDSNSRQIGVMVNNHPDARKNHAGLNDAYLVYEIIVEGGLTRLFAIYKDKDTDRIGSVRSSRHYFLDYALENDTIYVHFGGSPKAKSDINSLNIANIDGLYDSPFWRDKTLNVAYEHTAFTKLGDIKTTADKKKYRSTSDKKPVFNYSIKPVKLDELENAEIANEVSVEYSNIVNTSYKYDSVKGVYSRYVNGKEHTDAITKSIYTVKNIVVVKVKNYTLDSSGRQELENIGTGDGYYITNGYAIPIKWSKSSRSAQTVYKDLNGNEIKLNDGNTYVQIQPINKKLLIS